MRLAAAFLYLIGFVAPLPARALATSSDLVPIFQLTARLTADLGKQPDCVGDMLLRELQRQAVLISARDELGMATRDMVLHEPFQPSDSCITTVLAESRITRGKTAELCLRRFGGPQPNDLYSLADLQVDTPANPPPSWIQWQLPKDELIDYPLFVLQCEAASRGDYLAALRAENVTGHVPPQPVKWVASPAPADAEAITRLSQFDVFSQYLAVRRLHGQIRDQGASVERLEALVRGYAHLAALTRGQWSQADKVFTARALLYAQRLVVHDGNTAASLYVRMYAEAFAGLHAAALDDLSKAENDHSTASPSWLSIVRAMCEYDLSGIEKALAIGPWQYRPLATFEAAIIAADVYPEAQHQAAISRALDQYSSMFTLTSASNLPGDENMPRPADLVINTLPVVLAETLRGSDLPPSVKGALRAVAPGDLSYAQLAKVRDGLVNSARDPSAEATEPSLAVLADLIEQQEMLAVVHRAWTAHRGNTVPNELQKLLENVRPIINAHEWGPYVKAIGMSASADGERMTRTLAKIKPRDLGMWASEAGHALVEVPHAVDIMVQGWEKITALEADSLVDEVTANTASLNDADSDSMQLAQDICRTSPHSAALMKLYLNSIPQKMLSKTEPLYGNVLHRVETEFANRPQLMKKACDICEEQGDYARSFKLLQQLDKIEPTAELCARLSRDTRWLGNHDAGISYLMRGVHLTDDTDEVTSLYQYAAVCLIEDRRYSDAISCLQASADSPTTRTWQLLARCHDVMGQPEDAEECLRQDAALYPFDTVLYYLWAKRTGRKDVDVIHKTAMTITSAPDSELMNRFYLSLADDRDGEAFTLLQNNLSQVTDALQAMQLVVLAAEEKRTINLEQAKARSSENDSFADAFSALASSQDIAAATAAFDAWAHSQLTDEDAVNWYSLAGRFLVASGHVAEGRNYLIRAIHQTPRERPDFYLAWRALQKLGNNPGMLINASMSQ